jgi:hypothetical protein
MPRAGEQGRGTSSRRQCCRFDALRGLFDGAFRDGSQSEDIRAEVAASKPFAEVARMCVRAVVLRRANRKEKRKDDLAIFERRTKAASARPSINRLHVRSWCFCVCAISSVCRLFARERKQRHGDVRRPGLQSGARGRDWLREQHANSAGPASTASMSACSPRSIRATRPSTRSAPRPGR